MLVQTSDAMIKESSAGRCALIEQDTGKVVNVIMLDPSANWSPPAGHIVIFSDSAGPGDTWDGKEFKTPPPEPAPSPTPIQASGNDIAELMQQIDESLIEPGDIVAVSETGSGMRRSNKPYDKNMIGIISTNPGVVLGDSQGVNQQKVALVGTVPVKVSIENGPIEPGDALTSSSAFGVAMKATKAGRVIGIALELFDTNNLSAVSTATKKIMVLVNPHWQGNDLGAVQNGEGQIVNANLQQGLAAFGLIVNKYGVLEVEKLKAKIIVTEQIEMKDKATGEIYCTWMENGEWVKVKSSCEDLKNEQTQITNDQSNPSPEEQPPDEQPPIEEPPAKGVCDTTHLNLCTMQTECETAGVFWYNESCHPEPEAPPQTESTSVTEQPPTEPPSEEVNQ